MSAESKETSPSIPCNIGTMSDEYGQLDDSGQTFLTKNFLLESGDILPEAHARYKTFGSLNNARDNVIIVCHALTGNACLDEWWGGLLGEGAEFPFDTSKYFFLCANVLGSCYGSTGPMSLNPRTGMRYGKDFPPITIRDSVRLHLQIIRELQVKKIFAVIGGSMGGMQALEWVLLAKDLVQSAVLIGCNAKHSAWQIGISETQRQAIYTDFRWRDGDFDLSDPPLQGLSLARQIAMISYRSMPSYHIKFGRETDSSCSESSKVFQVQKYLHYQGQKFLQRFDAWTYITLTKLMDSHDIAQSRTNGSNAPASAEEVLQSIQCPVLVLGMSSDVLYPLSEQEHLAKWIRNARLGVIETIHGHDGFLLEQEQVGKSIKDFLIAQAR